MKIRLPNVYQKSRQKPAKPAIRQPTLKFVYQNVYQGHFSNEKVTYFYALLVFFVMFTHM